MLAHYREQLRSSPDAQARKMAVEGLARIKTEESQQALVDALMSDPVEPVRVRAAQALASLRPSAALATTLARAVADPNPEVVSVVVRAMGNAPNSALSDALFSRLGRGLPHVQTVIENALSEVYRSNPAPFVERVRRESDDAVVIAGVRVLQSTGHPSMLPFMRDLMRSPRVVIREASVRAIASLPGPEAAQALSLAMKDAQETVRLTAIDGIAERAQPSHIPLLSAALLDPAVEVRCRVTRALARYPLRVVAEPLDAALHDPTPEVRSAALATLLELGEADSLRIFSEAWPKVAHQTGDHLRRDPRAEKLSSSLSSMLAASPLPEVRLAALLAIAALEPNDFAPLVVRALEDPVAAVRLAAIRLLGPVDSPESRRRVSELLKDPDSAVREAVQRLNLRVVRNG
jgi:HEAT repeat protein